MRSEPSNTHRTPTPRRRATPPRNSLGYAQLPRVAMAPSSPAHESNTLSLHLTAGAGWGWLNLSCRSLGVWPCRCAGHADALAAKHLPAPQHARESLHGAEGQQENRWTARLKFRFPVLVIALCASLLTMRELASHRGSSLWSATGLQVCKHSSLHTILLGRCALRQLTNSLSVERMQPNRACAAASLWRGNSS